MAHVPLRTYCKQSSSGLRIEPFWRWTMRRIGTMLLLFTAVLTLVAQKSAEHVKTYTPDAIHWGAAPNALPPGAELSVLEGNPMAAGGLHNAFEDAGWIQDPAAPPSSSRARDGDLG